MTRDVSRPDTLKLRCCAALCFSLFAAEKPDVLVVIADQWSPRFTSWDNKEVRTPHLDSLAREGMIFDACYTTSPVCMPAVVSRLTGLYPHNADHGLWGNRQAIIRTQKTRPCSSTSNVLAWTTAQIGKTHWTTGPAWLSSSKTAVPSSKCSASIMWRKFQACRTPQTNLSAGYKPKVQRLREAEAKK